ncbi:VOC family protein [Pseudonocardia nigra]|uniref:VOC family protein n=1 Tax=Pseudonocardia nigra TaxID=1921578 RepID=UPI001C5FFA7F|nr:VOC family protein [Pseudonocardia nigra]
MLATYKDLCVDAVDAERSARFWSAALGLGCAPHRESVVRLPGPTPQHTVWVNAVPEPKVVKNRLHLDVHTGSVAELVELGATVLDDTLPWTVMADPEGGEFCAFVREEPPPQRLYELVLDARDAHATAAWWATLLGGRLVDDGNGFWVVGDIPGAPFEWLCVNPSEDPKVGKNRVHIDVVVPDIERVLDHGARLLRPSGGDVGWDVLADPEGNEMCAFRP